MCGSSLRTSQRWSRGAHACLSVHPAGRMRPAIAMSSAKLARVRPLGADPVRSMPGRPTWPGPCGPRLPAAHTRAHLFRLPGEVRPPGEATGPYAALRPDLAATHRGRGSSIHATGVGLQRATASPASPISPASPGVPGRDATPALTRRIGLTRWIRYPPGASIHRTSRIHRASPAARGQDASRTPSPACRESQRRECLKFSILPTVYNMECRDLAYIFRQRDAMSVSHVWLHVHRRD
jgi:hypothetical protein